MNQTNRFFTRAWVIALIGLMALSLVIWFVGPLITIAEYAPLVSIFNRVMLIIVCILIWVINALVKQIRANRANKKIMEGLTDGDADADASGQAYEEAGVVRERFDEAMTVLRSRRGKDGKRSRRSLYELPWYIIIGPPGSGKTTALMHSGLDFPLAEQFGKEALRGVGGTRNCDWWFTNEAVLIDTAGRYVTQDSDKRADSAGWINFLQLLKKYRRRRPINGALIAISLSDILLQSEQERSMHVRAIKTRLQELHTHLGVRFPVYVLFTKCDLVAGFTEFFDDFGRDDRAQVWGMTFPYEEERVLNQFNAEYEALIKRLNDKLLSRMHAERDLKWRTKIFGFVQQMSMLQENVFHFLDDVFRGSRYEDTTLLRGVYFTSGTQEGTPIDRIMGALSRSFGLDQQALPSFRGRGKSYFLTDLMKRVIFNEADLTGANRRVEKRRYWLQKGSYVAAIVAAMGAALVWSTSFTRNQVYVNEMSEGVQNYQAFAGNPVTTIGFDALLPRLETLYATTQVYSDFREDVPFTMGVGLYQGRKLDIAAQAAYQRELNHEFLPRIADRLEEQLRTNDDLDYQYEALKTYIMLGRPEVLEKDQLIAWMSLDWEQYYNPNQQGRLQSHLTDLLSNDIQPIVLDDNLIAQVRRDLQRVPLARLVYNRMKREYSGADEYAMRVSDIIGPAGREAFKRKSGASMDQQIEGMFTYRGFYDIFQQQNLKFVEQFRTESWVFGGNRYNQAELGKLDRDIDKLYLNDYILTWEEILEDMDITDFNSVSHGIQVVDVLSGVSSPIVHFLEGVEQQTALAKLPDGAGKVAQLAGDQAARRNRLARFVRDNKAAAPEFKPGLPGKKVDDHFEQLNVLVRSRNGAQPIDRIIGLLSELYAYLNTLSAASERDVIRAASSKGQGALVVQRLRTESTRQPQPLKRWLRKLAANTNSVTYSGARRKLNAKWKSTVLPVCRKALYNRYPVFKTSKQDITLADFGRFFGKDGSMDRFFDDNLKAFVDTSRAKWRWRRSGGASLGIPNRVLTQFQHAALIRDTFFQDGGTKPTVKFNIKPDYLDAQAASVTLNLNGQEFEYRHGPQRIESATWPSSTASGTLRLFFKGVRGDSESIKREGAWSWFRYLNENPIKATASDRMIVTMKAKKYTTRYEIHANSVNNPFMLKELSQFRCPEQL